MVINFEENLITDHKILLFYFFWFYFVTINFSLKELGYSVTKIF
jgi:hypothetical protein